MSNTGVHVEGVKDVAQSLEDFAESVENDLTSTFVAIGGIIVDEAKSIVPVRTGRLQKTITAVAKDDSTTVTAGSNAVQYAGVIHKRKPFLTLALQRKTPDAVKAIERQIDGLIKNI